MASRGRSVVLLWLLLHLASNFLRTVDGHRGGQRSLVLELTADSLAPAIDKYDVIMVEFYAPWCGHCKHLAPEYERASQILSQQAPHVKLAKIDSDKYSTVTPKYKINGFPTLRLYTNGIATDTEYEGPRTADGIVSYVKRALIPPISILSKESEIPLFVSNVSDNSPLFIGFGLEASVLDESARKHRRVAWFAVIQEFSEKVMVDFDFDKKPALVVSHPKVAENGVFYGPFEGSDIGEFVQQNLMPLLSPVENPDTVKRLRQDGRPIAIGVVNIGSDDTSKAFIKKLKAAAFANRAFVFAYVEAARWPDFVRPFGIERKSPLPTMVIWKGESQFSTSDDLEAFMGPDAEAQLSNFLLEFKEDRVKLRSLIEPSFLQTAKEIVFGIPTLIIVCGVLVLVFVQQGRNWKAFTTSGDYVDDHRERGRRTDLEGDIVADRGLGDSAEHVYLSRKSEKRD